MEESTVSHSSLINDIRTQPEFKGITFSRYKKTEVKNQFIENMLKGKIEPACYWCAEFVCAGHYAEIWEDIILYLGKHIHIGNPKLAIYLEKRYTIFKNIMDKGMFINELELRNNSTIRRLFAEVICVLTLSAKHNSFETVKIKREDEFDITQISDKLKADSIAFVGPIFRPSDPKELLISINEFAYHIASDKKNMLSACYWIEWIIEFDLICKKTKQPVFCERRNNNVENKFQCDIIWLIWDVLVYYVKKRKNPFIENIMNSLLNIFCIKYTTASCKRRKYLLYFAVEIMTNHVPTNIELFQNKEVIYSVVEKIDQIYTQIKKNEDSPKTDYLFSNLDSKHNLESSIKKMELLNTIDFASKDL